MAELYNINSSEIVGGPGRLVWAPYGTPSPTKISDVMDLETYELKAPWKDLGATTDGIAISRGFDTEGFEVDQKLGNVDEDITAWTHSLSTNLAQNSLENRQLALVGSPIEETPPVLGTATTLSNAVTVGATILNVTSATDFRQGAFLKIGDELIKISSISANSLKLEKPVKNAYESAAEVTPVTELGTRRIGYGTPSEVPLIMPALISQKKDGTLYMAVIRKAKVTGDDKEQTFGKEKRTLPFARSAFPEDGVSEDENVYYEIEQVA
jgi:hypothetical protein